MTGPGVTVDLSEFLAVCGEDLPQPEQNVYEVSRDVIRHVAYAIDDYNALYLDEEYARTTRWAGVIAPPGYLYGHGRLYLAWPQLLGRIVDSEGYEFDMPDNMGDDWEFFRPARPGDTILSHSRPLDASVKHGARTGLMVLTRSKTEFVNQRGEPVARMHGATARWSGQRQRERGRLAATYTVDPRVAQRGRDTLAQWRSPDRARRYDRHDLRYEDVQEGAAIPELAIGPLTTAHTRRWELHVNNSYRPETGGMIVEGGHVPDLYAAGVMRIPWFGSMLIRWAGPNAWIHKLNYRNREWVLVGYTYYCRGTVTRKYVDDGRHLVHCDLRIENELGTITNTGSAVVELLPRAS
jgi:acyl dehydratase